MAWAWAPTAVGTARWVVRERVHPIMIGRGWASRARQGYYSSTPASDDGRIAGWPSSADIVGVVVIGRLVFVIASASGVVPMGAGLRPQSTQDVLRFRSVGIYAPQNTTALPVRADTSSSASSSSSTCIVSMPILSRIIFAAWIVDS